MLSKSLIQFSVDGWSCVPSSYLPVAKLTLKLKLQYFHHLMQRTDSFLVQQGLFEPSKCLWGYGD